MTFEYISNIKVEQFFQNINNYYYNMCTENESMVLNYICKSKADVNLI